MMMEVIPLLSTVRLKPKLAKMKPVTFFSSGNLKVRKRIGPRKGPAALAQERYGGPSGMLCMVACSPVQRGCHKHKHCNDVNMEVSFLVGRQEFLT